MRSIANFPTGGNRRRGRRIPDQGKISNGNSSNSSRNSNSNSNSNSWSQASPVWGRSAAAIVAISSSPSSSSFGSNDSMNSHGNNKNKNKINNRHSSSSRGTSQSPVLLPQQSPVLGRSARATNSATRSPRWMRRNDDSNNNDNDKNNNHTMENHQQQRAVHNRSRSPSPFSLSSPISIDDHRDEITTTTTTSNYPSLQLQALSSSLPLHLPHLRQMPSHELCTIAEDRRISSNTLSHMTINSTAQQIAKSPVLAKCSMPQPRQQQQQQNQQQNQHHPTRMHHSSPKFCDPYNDDSYDDPRDKDCAGCWVYQKSVFWNWWPFGNQSNSNDNNNNNTNGNIYYQDQSRSRTDGFPTGRRRIHVRRTSF